MSPSVADLRPPCLFHVDNNSHPYVAMGFGPPMNKNDPLFVIKVEDGNVSFYDMIFNPHKTIFLPW